MAIALSGMPSNFAVSGLSQKHDAAGAADVLDAARAVAAAARQHDGDAALAGVLRERAEEMIDRQREAVARDRGRSGAAVRSGMIISFFGGSR